MNFCFKQSPWYGSTANDINWVNRVKMQSILQKYITHSISSTINLPENVTEEEVSTIYKQSYSHGLKGITVYRDGSRSGVMVTNKETPTSFNYIDAPKRPKELEAEAHIIKSNGNSITVIIGLLDNKPYEIFIDTVTDFKGKGKIVKKKRGEYWFISEDIPNGLDITAEMSDEEVAITRLVSTSLRHGANIKFIVEQLLKIGDNMFGFNRLIARALKKYIPEGEKSSMICDSCGQDSLVFEEGCISCKNCGNSKCG